MVISSGGDSEEAEQTDRRLVRSTEQANHGRTIRQVHSTVQVVLGRRMRRPNREVAQGIHRNHKETQAQKNPLLRRSRNQCRALRILF